jgi:PAS domain S-box-containing protein
LVTREVLNALPDAVVVLSPDRKVTGWFSASERLFGYRSDEVAGKPIDQLLTPTDENGNPCCFGPCEPDRVLSITREMSEYEILVTRKDGRPMWIGLRCAFERDAERRLTEIVAVARDASKRKRVDLEKSEVISAVSHELRSPLTSVKGFTSTLINKWDRFDDETKLQLLRTVNSDTDRVTRLLGELLDISRIEAGRLQLRRHFLKLEEIIERVIHRIEPQASSHRIKSASPKEVPAVFADPDKVEQVLTNLVENAAKYTEGGLIQVSCDTEDGFVRVSVSDEGEGIPPEHRQQVFRKFFRHGGKAQAPSGTGLGLYIAKGLVEAHGGRTWVQEAPGGGALFAFTLPTSGPESLGY